MPITLSRLTGLLFNGRETSPWLVLSQDQWFSLTLSQWQQVLGLLAECKPVPENSLSISEWDENRSKG